MKKSILIFCAVLTGFGLTALGFMNRDHTLLQQKKSADCKIIGSGFDIMKPLTSNFHYEIASRFNTTISLADLKKATSIKDILPEKATWDMISCHASQVSILDGDQEPDQGVTGESEMLNSAQRKLLQTAGYSTNIYIRADYKVKHPDSGGLQDEYLTYYLTVIPEQEARYETGNEALIYYLKSHSLVAATVAEEGLQPGKLRFTVTETGEVADVTLLSTSGYPSLDDTMQELVRGIPGKWQPAANAAGEKVAQDLVFFFGMIGC